MSRNEKLLILGAAVVGAAALHKIADKEARELRIPLALVGVAIWALS